jgi:ParB family transcriptional regulator, chromosome partitioning protein
VPKRRIIEAVSLAKGEQVSQLIDHLKKTDMAKEAERLLAGTGWLPDPLLTVDFGEVLDVDTESYGEPGALPEFLASGDKGTTVEDTEEPQSQVVAAE